MTSPIFYGDFGTEQKWNGTQMYRALGALKTLFLYVHTLGLDVLEAGGTAQR